MSVTHRKTQLHENIFTDNWPTRDPLPPIHLVEVDSNFPPLTDDDFTSKIQNLVNSENLNTLPTKLAEQIFERMQLFEVDLINDIKNGVESAMSSVSNLNEIKNNLMNGFRSVFKKNIKCERKNNIEDDFGTSLNNDINEGLQSNTLNQPNNRDNIVKKVAGEVLKRREDFSKMVSRIEQQLPGKLGRNAIGGRVDGVINNEVREKVSKTLSQWNARYHAEMKIKTFARRKNYELTAIGISKVLCQYCHGELTDVPHFPVEPGTKTVKNWEQIPDNQDIREITRGDRRKRSTR